MLLHCLYATKTSYFVEDILLLFLHFHRVKKIKFGPEIFYGRTPNDVPYVQLSAFNEEIMVSYSGPDNGLMYAESSRSPENSKLIL